jgi:hypothetical protein
MSYASALAEVGTVHRQQIEADLADAMEEREASLAALEDLNRRIALLEGLLKMRGESPTSKEAVEPRPPTRPDGPMTLHAAMHKVLKESQSGKLRAGEIIAEIERQGLYRMRDGRPPESQQIHARAGHYPHMFGKDGSYFYAK